MRPKPLEGADREAALAELGAAGWQPDDTGKAVGKTFRFKDFNAAFGWMARVALEAEKLDHHPNGAMSTTGSGSA